METEGWEIGRDSYSKCCVWFVDGNIRTFYSMDWSYTSARYRDRELGMQRLRKAIQRWGAKATCAIIYDLINDKELERYEYGTKTNI